MDTPGAITNINSGIPFNFLELKKELILLDFRNPDARNCVSMDVSRLQLLFLFTNGIGKMKSSIDEKSIPLDNDNFGMITYPVRDLHLDFELEAKSELRLLSISIAELHEVFGNLSLQNPDVIEETLRSYFPKNHITWSPMTTDVKSLIYHLFTNRENTISKLVFQKAKVIEFLSLFAETGGYDNCSKKECPFITKSEDWEKIRKVEKIITSELSIAPSLRGLARRLATNEFKLKVGFKHLYNTSIYKYYNNHRLNYAKEVLAEGNESVRDIALEIGFSNPSPFISAFKKKFGITPKQFKKSASNNKTVLDYA